MWGSVGLLCSRNAHDRNVLVRGAQWEANRPPSRKSEVGDNKKTVMGSGQVPFVFAEQGRGWSLMIFCARATRGRGLPSLGLMARLGVQWVGG